MLDLFRSRDTAMRYVLIGILSLVALSMVITLIPTFGGGGMMSQRDDILADVCGEQVTNRMVAQVAAQAARERQFSSSMAEFMIPQMVNQFVGELATSCAANEMGIKVADNEVAQYIQGRMPQLFQDGAFVGADVYAKQLEQMNTTIPEFEKRVRQQIMLEKMQRIAFDGIVVTPKEVESEYAKKSEKVRLDVVKFDPQEIRKGLKPTTAELEEHLKANAIQFQIQPKRNVALVIADADKLGASLEVTPDMLNKMYDENKAQYRIEEKVRARHILIKAEENASKEVKAKAKAKAEDLLKQIKGGADFAELAKKHSEDPGSGQKGGDLDFFQRGQMVKPFEEAAFKMKANEIAPAPVESVFGYHIIQTTAKQDALIKPLSEVKDQLTSQYRQRQMFEKIPALIEAAQKDLAKTPAQAEEVAKKHGLFFARAEKTGAGDPFPVLGPNPELEAAIAGLKKGGVTHVIQTRDNKMFAAVLEDEFPARPATLAEVEARVKDSLLDKKAAEIAEQQAKAFEAKLQQTKNFYETAKALGHKVVDTGDFARNGQMKDIGPSGYFGEQPFLNAVGANVGIFRVGTVPYFFRVAAKTPADLSALETERPQLVQMLKDRKLRERREMFEDGLVSYLKGRGKVTVREDLVKRLTQSYTNRG